MRRSYPFAVRAESRPWLRHGAASTPAADELQHYFAPVRPRAMLGKIKPLPGAERQHAIVHRDMERDASEHRLDVGGHIVGSFGIVHPAGIGRREAIERGDKIALHVGIGILLDHQRRRSVAQKQKERAVLAARIGDEASGLAGELEKTLVAGFDGERRRRDQLRQIGRASCRERV